MVRPSSTFQRASLLKLLANFNYTLMQPPGRGGKKAYIFGPGRITKWPPCPYIVKAFTIFSRSTTPIALKLGMYYLGGCSTKFL